MIEDLGDLLVEDGEEMFEALSQMPVISISSLNSDLKSVFFQDSNSSSSPKRRKSIPSNSILAKKSPR